MNPYLPPPRGKRREPGDLCRVAIAGILAAAGVGALWGGVDAPVLGAVMGTCAGIAAVTVVIGLGT